MRSHDATTAATPRDRFRKHEMYLLLLVPCIARISPPRYAEALVECVSENEHREYFYRLFACYNKTVSSWHVLSDGRLVLAARRSLLDAAGAMLRCRASNAAGVVLSRPVLLQPVSEIFSDPFPIHRLTHPPSISLRKKWY
ncbi:hypothetical protein EVAR_99859_1 [Eumeta japonica]|uniref:Uncharacterized protein n=1 Tax=Eumeta variegata TaxID=151549 RepID=A0A4C1ZH51_EUMVA|nr:hypothetical protein EVAR_99859_1 [Eumeta japonica]